MDKLIQDKFENLLLSDLMPALGCTEPIAIALAAAKAKEVLGKMPEKIVLHCSGNIIKNVKSVIVPNSGGLKGIEVAAALGIVGGDPARELKVLETITEEDIKKANEIIAEDIISVDLVEGISNLYIRCELTAGKNSSSVEIKDGHTNITKITKDETVLMEKNVETTEELKDFNFLNIDSILEFANSVNFHDRPELASLLEQQIEYNTKISEEGLSNDYGLTIGKTVLESGNRDNIKTKVKASAAAASDARMGGCVLPVMINSGSGNQGITVSVPVITFAKHIDASHDKLLRALIVSNLVGIYQKQYIGKLSAFCGVVSAGAGAGCGIGYLLEMSNEQIHQIITNTLVTSGGIVCDGAKASCASKIAIALENALLSVDLAEKNLAFHSGEGLVGKDVEETIKNIGRMAREGMKSTDIEILNIMIGK